MIKETIQCLFFANDSCSLSCCSCYILAIGSPTRTDPPAVMTAYTPAHGNFPSPISILFCCASVLRIELSLGRPFWGRVIMTHRGSGMAICICALSPIETHDLSSYFPRSQVHWYSESYSCGIWIHRRCSPGSVRLNDSKWRSSPPTMERHP